jgi:hypothetical protein
MPISPKLAQSDFGEITIPVCSKNNHGQMKKTKHPQIIYNDDTCSLRYIPEPHTMDKVGTAVDYFKGTQVGAICWSLAGQIAFAYPSKKVENAYEALREKDELYPIEGITGGNLMSSLYKKGIDYMPILIERAHRIDRQSGLFSDRLFLFCQKKYHHRTD